MALMCVACCITCILVRRRCLKRRALARVRMAASNNYYPAVAHYTSHVGAVQVRLEDPCAANIHETQQLVSEAQSTHIPPVSPSHLDTKVGEGWDWVAFNHVYKENFILRIFFFFVRVVRNFRTAM